MLEFLVDYIFLCFFFAAKIQQIVGIPIWTNCAPLIAYIFSTHMKQDLYSLCSQPKGNSWHLGSISRTGTLIMFCPWTKNRVWELPACARCIPWNCSISDDLCCSWEQRHDREHCFCFLPRFTFVDWETINLILPFITNVTLAISISQIFCSWVAIYLASLSHSLNDMPENVVYQKLKHLDDVVFRVLAFGVCVIKMNNFSMS